MRDHNPPNATSHPAPFFQSNARHYSHEPELEFARYEVRPNPLLQPYHCCNPPNRRQRKSCMNCRISDNKCILRAQGLPSAASVRQCSTAVTKDRQQHAPAYADRRARLLRFERQSQLLAAPGRTRLGARGRDPQIVTGSLAGSEYDTSQSMRETGLLSGQEVRSTN